VGRLVSKAAADNVIPVTLELGGKSPNIVFADADVASAVPFVVNSIFQTGVWTRDVGKAHRLAHELQVGQVYINNYGAGGGVELPFGGLKKSGHGREKGYEALYEYSQVKTVAIQYGG